MMQHQLICKYLNILPSQYKNDGFIFRNPSFKIPNKSWFKLYYYLNYYFFFFFFFFWFLCFHFIFGKFGKTNSQFRVINKLFNWIVRHQLVAFHLLKKKKEKTSEPVYILIRKWKTFENERAHPAHQIPLSSRSQFYLDIAWYHPRITRH